MTDIEYITQFIRDMVDDRKVVIGVSGGVDSAVCMNLCARAIGADRVIAYHLPVAHSLTSDTKDAINEARRAGVDLTIRTITKFVNAIANDIVKPHEPNGKQIRGNVAARVRMVYLYTLANKHEALVCGTGNRTEYFLGYTTKFGDNAADFYPILHLFKTEVWDLARELGVLPEIVNKAPSAGLWIGQTDEDEIGIPYTEIDSQIKEFFERGELDTSRIDLRLLRLHLDNWHKSNRGPSLLDSRW